jgi:hypothetical protein
MPINTKAASGGTSIMDDTYEKLDREEIKARLERLIRAVIKEVHEEEYDDDWDSD